MTQESSFLLTLLRLGIHPGAEEKSTPANIDWQRVLDLAGTQGVVAIAWDGYSRLYEAGMVSVDMDKQVKKQWIGRVIQSHEWKYPTYRSTIGHLASFYAKHGIKMMVLKGYGLSLPRRIGHAEMLTSGTMVNISVQTRRCMMNVGSRLTIPITITQSFTSRGRCLKTTTIS